MTKPSSTTFTAQLQRPATPGMGDAWAFLVLPKTVSDTLQRRGRVSVQDSRYESPFQATLEPDDQLSHWLKVSEELRRACRGRRHGERPNFTGQLRT